jgi:hypothetical protein
MSRFPAAFRLPAFASRSSDTRQGIGPSLRSAYRTRSSGPRRGYHVPHARATTGVGASYTPRTAILTRSAPHLRPAPAASQRPVLTPRSSIPSAGPQITRHQRRFKRFTRPAFPSPVAPGWNGRPWASPPSFEPRRPEPATHVRVGTGLEHKPGTTLTTSAEPPIRASTRNVRPRVATKRSDYADPTQPDPPTTTGITDSPRHNRDVGIVNVMGTSP